MTNRVAANIIIGRDGSTVLGGTSAALSFPADRKRFHSLRSEFAAILIGGNTARNEPYSKTPLPLIVITRSWLPTQIQSNPLALSWQMPLREAVEKAIKSYGDLLIEAGPTLIQEGVAGGLIGELFVTVSDSDGGEHPIDIKRLLEEAEEISRELVDGGLFLHYRLAPSHL